MYHYAIQQLHNSRADFKTKSQKFGKQRGFTDNLKFGRNLRSQVVNKPLQQKREKKCHFVRIYFDVISELPI